MSAPPTLHPTDKTLQSYGLGKLKESSAAAVDKHLEVCPDCRRRVGELSPDSFLGRLRDAKGGPEKLSPARPRPEGPVPPSRRGLPAGARLLADTLPLGLADNPDYEVIRELGRGGMGVVYLVHNRLMDRREVLKVMNRDLMERSGVLDRFLREIQSVARLHHEHVVTAYSAMRFGESIGFAMEHVDGFDLARLVKLRGPLPVAHACRFIYQAALGLQHAHEKGMVHRDIKPGNLMLSRQGDQPMVKVLDFGLAKATKEVPLDGALTGVGQMLGTPDYIAPEQITDAQSADIRADIYSLGCTLYFLLTGGPPFEGNSLFDILQAHHSMDAQLLNIVRPEVPGELAVLVAKMMAKDPEHRFQTPREVADALKPFCKKVSERPPAELGKVAAPEADQHVPRAEQVAARARATPEARWESLIDLHQPEGLADVLPTLAESRRRPSEWSWQRIAAPGLMAILLGIIVVIIIEKNRTTVVVEKTEAPGTVVGPDRPAARPGKAGNPLESHPPVPPAAPAPKGGANESRSAAGTGDLPLPPSVVESPAPPPAGKLPVSTVAKAMEPGPPFPPRSYRVATNGLAGKQYIDPLSSWPDPHGFNRPDTVERWATPNDFAQLRTRAALVYPTLPVSRYVCEVEVTPSASGDMKFSLGDVDHSCQICLTWIPERKIVRCWLAHWDGGGWGFGGERTFDPNHRISLKVVVGDGSQTLFHENKPVLSSACWPVDCRLVILSETPDSGVVHRCSLRPLTAQDVADCGWTTPPTDLTVTLKEAAARQAKIDEAFAGPAAPQKQKDDTAARLARISEGYPDHPKPGKNFAVKTTGTPMAWIQPGEFMMGSRDPAVEKWLVSWRHPVRLTTGFWMAQIEVTQGEYRKVTGANPSRVTGSPYLPVDWVAWDEAAAYCRKLTERERKASRLLAGYEYRLPTEAEWEYACRAGSDEGFSVPQQFVWSRRTSECRPHEVAESQPNKWGLYDMHGNAMEWCLDAWSEYPKGKKEVTVDPFKIGQPDKDTFVVRGGSWWGGSELSASDYRFKNHNNPNGFRGFRIVLGPSREKQRVDP